MFQRLTNLFFGEVEKVAAELNGPKPCVTEADEDGWMIVNLPGRSDFFMASGALRRSALGGAHGGQGGGTSRDIVQMHPYNTALHESAHFILSL